MANHLISEKSPYLQQHAHNPVDWYPWGEAAFEKARAEDKPIFLSVGYSTCHWCHVMERESFESEELAAILNRWFVPVKVDREERPDVDRIYMTFVQASTGGGGWPMSVFLTPELKPFFGGTYFPPDNRYGRPGFGAILQRIAEAWRNDRAPHRAIERRRGGAARAIYRRGRAIHRHARSRRCSIPRSSISAACSIRRTADSAARPSFPGRWFSISCCAITRDRAAEQQEALDMTLDTLRAMANGGMHDQLGGGFHRYSVDERWFVPHFEKMLYDQAQLAVSYLEAFQITHDPFYAKIARSTLDYVLRDMTHPDGGFYSAEDADSVIDPANPKEKGEGAFYIWSAAELEQFPKFASVYGVERDGNVPDDPHGEFTGKIFCICDESLDDATEAELAAGQNGAAGDPIQARPPASGRQNPDRLERPDDFSLRQRRAGLDDARYLEAAQRAARIYSHAHVRREHRHLAAPVSRWRRGHRRLPGRLRVLHRRAAGSL